MRFLGLLLIIAAIVLGVLNPSMDDFERFVADHSERLIQEEAGHSEMGDWAAGVGAGLVERYLNRVAERENYVLFSTYTIDLDGPEQDEEHWRFLGIADQFVELERPASFKERESAP